MKLLRNLPVEVYIYMFRQNFEEKGLKKLGVVEVMWTIMILDLDVRFQHMFISFILTRGI